MKCINQKFKDKTIIINKGGSTTMKVINLNDSIYNVHSKNPEVIELLY